MLIVEKPLHGVSAKASAKVCTRSPSKYGIKLLATGRYLQHALSLLSELMSSLEAASRALQRPSVECILRSYCQGIHLALGDGILHFVDLDLTEALDLNKVTTSGGMH